jgi:hypothetical protein
MRRNLRIACLLTGLGILAPIILIGTQQSKNANTNRGILVEPDPGLPVVELFPADQTSGHNGRLRARFSEPGHVEDAVLQELKASVFLDDQVDDNVASDARDDAQIDVEVYNPPVELPPFMRDDDVVKGGPVPPSKQERAFVEVKPRGGARNGWFRFGVRRGFLFRVHGPGTVLGADGARSSSDSPGSDQEGKVLAICEKAERPSVQLANFQHRDCRVSGSGGQCGCACDQSRCGKACKKSG